MYTQSLDPLAGVTFWPFGYQLMWTPLWSTIFAALPVVVLFYFLVPRRWLASKAGAAGALSAIVIAIVVYGMPIDQTLWSFGYGVGFGLLPVGWTIFNAMLLYNITVETGQFTIIKRSVASLSGDARIQSVLIGFSFGAFLEGAAGGGTPVAICGAIMVGLGFNPFLAAVLCLIANTSPVAYGGLGTPILVLSDVTGLPGTTISTMAGHQLPFLSLLIPAYMVKCMCSWRKTFEVWPALLVSGGSFAVFQFVFATIHEYLPAVVLYPMTDIGGGIFSLVVTAIFLNFWRPKEEWHFNAAEEGEKGRKEKRETESSPPLPGSPSPPLSSSDPHAAEAMALMGGESAHTSENETKPLTIGNVTLAWTPFIIMSVLLMLTGIVRQMESKRGQLIEDSDHPLLTSRTVEKLQLGEAGLLLVGRLEGEFKEQAKAIQDKFVADSKRINDRDKNKKLAEDLKINLRKARGDHLAKIASILNAEQETIFAKEKPERHGPIYVSFTEIETNYLIEVPTIHNNVMRAEILRPVDKEGKRKDEPESAKFNFAWLTAPGTAVFIAALLSMALLRMRADQIAKVTRRTFVQMKIPIPTIAFMIGLSYVTRYAGMDATLGIAFANTGFLYPFFAAILGWLGVFLTGTDAGSNALFGSLQKITATTIHTAGAFGPSMLSDGLSQGQAQILVCTANSTGGVMGKMIDAQSICVATAATHQLGKEADILKAVVWHSILLACIVGLMTLLQAYVWPFTWMVPSP